MAKNTIILERIEKESIIHDEAFNFHDCLGFLRSYVVVL